MYSIGRNQLLINIRCLQGILIFVPCPILVFPSGVFQAYIYRKKLGFRENIYYDNLHSRHALKNKDKDTRKLIPLHASIIYPRKNG